MEITFSVSRRLIFNLEQSEHMYVMMLKYPKFL